MTSVPTVAASTLTDQIRAGVRRWPDTPVAFLGTRENPVLTLAQIHQQARRVAAGLRTLGLEPGDRVAMQLPNWPEAIVAYIAAVELRIAIIPVVHIYREAELHFILGQSGARALIIPDVWRNTDYVERVTPENRPPSLEHVIVVGDRAIPGFLRWRDLVAHEPLTDLPDATADDPSLIIYTSGTTGVPKGVLHTQGTMAFELQQYLDHDPKRTVERNLVSFPIGHMAGFLASTRSFMAGHPTYFMDTWDPALAARTIAEQRITTSSGTPFHLQSLFEAADAEGLSLASLSGFLMGATNIPSSLVELADARGVGAFRCYGSTEHPTVSSGRSWDSLEVRATTDGLLMPGIEVRIVDDDDRDVPLGTPGEILSRGPDKFPGYTDPAFDADATVDGTWYRSGDIGILDEAGYLTITDRKKDLIIRGGENIASREVEDVLLAHPQVAEVAVVGLPDERYGERVCAVVVTRGGRLTLDVVRDHVAAAGLAKQKTPEAIVHVEEMPRTPSGKIQKQVLRARLRDGSLSPAG